MEEGYAHLRAAIRDARAFGWHRAETEAVLREMSKLACLACGRGPADFKLFWKVVVVPLIDEAYFPTN